MLKLGEGYMTVEMLSEHLKKLPKDGYIVIGGELVLGVEQRPGTIASGHFNPIMSHKGKKHIAIVFTRRDELSNGDVLPNMII